MFGATNVALDVKLFVEVKREGGVEGGGVEVAAGARDRFLGVVAGVGGIVAEDGERVGWAAGQAGAVVGGEGGATEEFLPPGSTVGAVRLRGGGVDTEGLEDGVEPALVLVDLLASEAKEEEEEQGKEGKGPYCDVQIDVVVEA